MKVVISGGGIAGLAAAVVMCQRGADVSVFEQLPASAAAGMGFILTKSMTAGWDGTLSGLGVCLDHYWRWDGSARLAARMPMPEGARGVRRADLLEALRSLLPEGIIHYGRSVTAAKVTADGAVTAVLVGDTEVDADLYIAADGVRSALRKAIFGDDRRRAARVNELIGVGVCPEWVGQGFHKFLNGRGGVGLGMVPVGAGELVWFIQFDRERFGLPADSAKGQRDFVARLMGQWPEWVQAVVGGPDAARTHLWQPVNVNALPCHHGRNIAFLGDAAHPLLPFTSQGVATALADAVDLGFALDVMTDLDSALREFSRLSLARSAPLVGAGRDLADRFLNGRAAEVPIAG